MSIALSLLGLSRVLEKDRIKKVVGVISSVVLIAFGAIILRNVFDASPLLQTAGNWTPAKSFAGCFVLTVTSPLTIVFWTGIFSAKAIEYGLSQRQLAAFGIGAGFATFLFMFSTMAVISRYSARIDMNIVRILNGVVGAVLLYYAVSRLVKLFSGSRKANIA
jgi:threonine/homoserine/homoserine lactone efflux protein